MPTTGSSSSITTVAEFADDDTVYALSESIVTVTEPSDSSRSSLSVENVRVLLFEDAGIVTVREPVVTPKSPSTATMTATAKFEETVWPASTVNVASPPSRIGVSEAVMPISGLGVGYCVLDAGLAHSGTEPQRSP